MAEENSRQKVFDRCLLLGIIILKAAKAIFDELKK